MSDAQGNLASNPETVTHTRNGNFEQTLLSYWTILTLPPPMNPGIDQVIVGIKFTPQTLMTPATKEIIVDAASGSEWTYRTPRRVCSIGVDGSNPGNIGKFYWNI